MRDEDETVILVDEADVERGTMDKLEAHRQALLHRAFSVFVFNGSGELLLQRRAEGKYHSGGLWSNTCCGHPRAGEGTAAAAARRLEEEMGFRCELERRFGFVYRAVLDDGLWEHEYDHVFTGRFDGSPDPDPREISEWRWIRIDDLRRELAEHPERFTAWFREAFEGLAMATA